MDNLIILAGNGKLPVNIIDSLKNKNYFVLIISNSGWDKKLERKNFKIVKLGSVITELLKLKKYGFHNIVLAGALTRPTILEIRPDFNTLKFLPKFAKVLLDGGDNKILDRPVTKRSKRLPRDAPETKNLYRKYYWQ